jgi:hypothetical protein
MIRTLAALLCWSIIASAGAMEIPPGEPLTLPSAAVQDEFGHSWSFAEDGSLVEEDADQGGLFKTAGKMLISNQPFTDAPAQSIRLPGDPDPWIAIGPRSMGTDVDVARFIHVSRKTGLCRWLDVLSNSGTDRKQVPLRIHYEFNWAPRVLEWRRDQHKDEIGALLQFGSRRTSAVALWWGSEGRMTAREGSTTASLEILADIGPGESVGLVHAVAVRGRVDEAQTLLNGLDSEQLGKDLPWLPELRMLNIRLGTTALDAMRSPDIDSIQLMSGERLRGSLMTPNFTSTSLFGAVTIQRADLAGLMRRANGSFSIFTRDGAVCAGTIGNETVTLALPTGDEISVPLAEVRIIAVRLGADARGIAAPSSGWEIATVDQQRLFVKQVQGPLIVTTAIGPIEIPFEALVSLEGYAGTPLRLKLANGSTLHAIGQADALTAVLENGQTIALSLARIQRMRLLGDQGESTDSALQVALVNGDILVGALAKPLTIASRYRTVEVVPEQLRGISMDGKRGQATVHFTDGSYLQGRLTDDVQLDMPWGAHISVPQIMLSTIGVGSGTAAAKKQIEEQARAMLRDLANPDAAKAQASGAWLADHRVELRDFLDRAYENADLPASAQRRLGLIIGKEF